LIGLNANDVKPAQQTTLVCSRNTASI
jgi:hypothetical protein